MALRPLSERSVDADTPARRATAAMLSPARTVTVRTVVRVVRGGSFLSAAEECRVSARGKEAPEFSAEWIGFRCVKDMQ